jgi:hypothetical protein
MVDHRHRRTPGEPAYEVTRDLPLEPVEIETPLVTMQGVQIAGKKLVLVAQQRQLVLHQRMVDHRHRRTPGEPCFGPRARAVEIETPLVTMQGVQIAGKKLVLAPILRAGIGFLAPWRASGRGPARCGRRGRTAP